MVMGESLLPSNFKILAVDDDTLNLEALAYILKNQGYQVANAQDGDEAIQYLEEHPGDIDIVVLDKMMPRMNGMEVLRRIKNIPAFSHIPVILQTASVGTDEVVEGIQAGAYYYLTKPFEDQMLVSVVNAAVREYAQQRSLLGKVQESRSVLNMIKYGTFEVRTLDEARTMATVLAGYFPDPNRVVIGLIELLTNAVEHGNLGVGYHTKSELMVEGRWEEEIVRRLALDENISKKVEVLFENTGDEVIVTMKDCGKGFDWKRYIDFDPVRMTDPNGRGIAKANIMAFDRMEYKGGGNEVVCHVYLKNAPKS
ncbi:MAG: two-component system response regulator [Rickettsiales bacterium]|jgi:CheY-like chemotaxis protein/anti-sigma regulatory factor (Ser/Thr protein kinase)|nr:two-component system response regulator [Rickettsiales bacterium]